MTVTFLSPVFGVLWGVVLLREQLSWSIIVGFAIILSGTGLVTGVHLRRKKNAVAIMQLTIPVALCRRARCPRFILPPAAGGGKKGVCDSPA